ncbi:uncharacterized protein C8Q71DRAFT_525308 [Rhodofomes roseus]|uniref:Uncharacterized protein n=1 Tax=Rhodofomes roseus TaxID=34475 RepID=A0ABQ8KKD9_9APHY|nr:uncharacterized protein C8Q71DRAFT_525308 [Rhodofomes roseus]KAH9838368.1 hypothetical protein C8Q71DRAFT_525308 [Rhodofomes roseus]
MASLPRTLHRSSQQRGSSPLNGPLGAETRTGGAVVVPGSELSPGYLGLVWRCGTVPFLAVTLSTLRRATTHAFAARHCAPPAPATAVWKFVCTYRMAVIWVALRERERPRALWSRPLYGPRAGSTLGNDRGGQLGTAHSPQLTAPERRESRAGSRECWDGMLGEQCAGSDLQAWVTLRERRNMLRRGAHVGQTLRCHLSSLALLCPGQKRCGPVAGESKKSPAGPWPRAGSARRADRGRGAVS